MPRLFRPFLFLLSLSLLLPAVMAQDATDQVRQWLQDNADAWGLDGKEALAWEVTDQYTDSEGRTFVYIRQTANGLAVEGAMANFVVKDGQVRGAGNRMHGHLATRLGTATPSITPEAAVQAAARHLGLQAREVATRETISATEAVLEPCGISREAIPARMAYRVVDGRTSIPLAWHLVIRETGGQHWWHVAVDAHDGTVVWKNDWVTRCTFPEGSFSRAYDAMEDLGQGGDGPALGGGSGAGYRVFAFPTESPLYGPHVWVDDPSDADASPYGWHDIDGVAGPEYTITRGNNVYAGEDFNDDDEIGYSPDGGSSLTFDFPYDEAAGPVGYLDAAITNLFYTCNVLHDVWHYYGFDEVSGNFQRTNYTGLGQGNDEVYAQAQDGGGLNNANFATPPDGWSGAMQMYLWRTSEGDSLIVNSPAAVVGGYAFRAAAFGPAPPVPPITADLVLMEDGTAPLNDGCDALVNAADLSGKIAVVDRGLCTFVSKAQAAEAAGAVGVVVINNVGGALVTMSGDGTPIGIPAVMISMADGQVLKNAMLQGGVVNATLGGPAPENIRDGDMDNGIIAHEYGHGISIRLTGGPADADCLWNDEQMGEGWSDWMAMVVTMRPGDQAETARGMANFVLDEGIAGEGLRPAPYTTNMAVNPYTYGNTNIPAFQGAHALGFIWATMLWDVTWALVNEEGFDPDPYHGTGGNNIAMRLILGGMKLQPCQPGFVDGRDAILLADELYYGGVHKCIIWEAFARRGLGYGASQGSSNSVTDQVQAFDIPADCMGVGIQDDVNRPLVFSVYPNPAQGQVTVRLAAPLKQDAQVRVLTADGRLIKELRFQGGQELSMDLGGLAPGLYLVQMEMAGQRMHQRLVVE